MAKVRKEIVAINKSFKYEGYFMLKVEGQDKWILRKGYERKTGSFKGKILVNLDTDIYSFEWDGFKSSNIEWVGNYKSIAEAVVDKEVTKIPEVKEPIVEKIEVVDDGVVRHEKFDQIKACIDANIPVYLVGPAGSGKNHTLEQIANDLGLDFYFTNSVQQEYKLTGFIDASGKYHETEFYRAFTNGGLFFLDEMDASIPEVLVLLNAAIANGYFDFPMHGKVEAHEDFRVVAAGNTVGNGADEQYTGRLVLDQATLDRFAIIEFDYSKRIELHLCKGNIELVDFIHSLRTQAKQKGIRATFSYRCITMVRKLEGKLEITELLKIAIFKGMDKDTINTFRTNNTDRYNNALRLIQQ
jgi:hypothetical protein